MVNINKNMECPLCYEKMDIRIEVINNDSFVSGKEEVVTGWDCECGISLDLYEK